MIFESILVISIAILIDLTLGDPRNKYHPTAWIGKLIAVLTSHTKNQNLRLEKLAGILIVVVTSGIVILLTSILNLGLSFIASNIFSLILTVVVGGLLLKTTIAICGMEKHANAVLKSLEENNLDLARDNLSMIVKRKTKNLDKNHVISGVLESISENIVDGITGPLFYFALLGLPGAFTYRVVNTADSMIGYKSKIFKNIGWFAATCDTILNYIPARLTGLIMILSAAILQNDWKKSLKTMIRDGKKTESKNAGYTMAALAGALETKFVKIDHYELGDGETTLEKEHVYSAIKIMKLTSVLFFGIITIPIITILSIIGWWVHA